MKRRNTVYVLSFDGVPMSGLLVESFKLLSLLQEKGYMIYLDLGYDIKPDKNNFFKEYTNEAQLIPYGISLERIRGLEKIEGYNQKFVESVLERIVCKEENDTEAFQKINEIAEQIKEKILETWKRLNVTFVVVENGTLPENIIFTQALYKAIEEYGYSNKFGKYVFWRDHDLMWWSEPGKYGTYPYKNTLKPKKSEYIEYFVLHDKAKDRITEWASIDNLHVLPNVYNFSPDEDSNSQNIIRQHYNIGDSDFVISRTTRIIRAKRIDRDILLVYRIKEYLKQATIKRKIFLLISGDIEEDSAETIFLQSLIDRLGLRDNVIFIGPLMPIGYAGEGWTVEDLLRESDINSFLTSYDYEGYGNPPGEAISCHIPYLCSRYEIYDDVYGKYGFKGIILETSKERDWSIDEKTVYKTIQMLTNDKYRASVVDNNYKLGEKILSKNRLPELLAEVYNI